MSDREFTRVNGRLLRGGRMLPPGPWDSEPDHEQFDHAGFVCLIHRGPSGALCGYVGVPPAHPWHGKKYDDVRITGDEWPNVHGGLTYADHCAGEICHVPAQGQPEHLYWLGFDCAHHLDVCPAHLGLLRDEEPYRGPRVVEPAFGWTESYRDIAYVRAETRRLAEQAANAEVSP